MARRPSFVGRSGERELLDGTLQRVRGGAGQALVVEGEAGIGKTRLVEELMAVARQAAFTVLQGECDEAARARPFAPLSRALASPDGDLLDRHGVTSDLAPAAQYLIIESIGVALERMAARSPVLLVIEDLHWADGGTLVALRTLARRIERMPVLVVGTTRLSSGQPELHAVVDELLRSGGRHLVLGALDDEAVGRLASQILGAEPGPSLSQRLAGAGGNPLFVIEYVNALVAEGKVTRSVDLADDVIPVEFRQSALRKLAQLSSEAANVVRMASVLGSPFSLVDLGVVLDRSAVELAPLLLHAVEAGMIAERGSSLSFVHDLVREAVYESIPRALRKQLHREMGRSLLEAGGDPLAVAHHIMLGAEERDDEAAGWLRRAARSISARAPEVSVELLQSARALMGPANPEQDDVLADLVMPLAWSGRMPDAEDVARRVLARHAAPRVAGPLRCGLVYTLNWQGRPAEALPYLSSEEPIDERDEVLLRAQGAVAKMFSFDLTGATADAAGVVDAAEKLGHDFALCTALGVQTVLNSLFGNIDEAISTGRRAIALADESPTEETHLAAPRAIIGMPLIAADLLEEAEHVLQAGRRIAGELGHAWSLPLFHAYLGATRFVAGEWDDAIAEFEASMEIADEVGIRMVAFTAVAGWLGAIRVHRDELEAAEETVTRAERFLAEGGPRTGMGILIWARALLAEARGDVEAAIGSLRGVWDLMVASGLHAEPWSGAALVRLYARHGRAAEALDIVPVIEAQVDRNPTPFMKGRALASRGLATSDPDLLARATDMYRSSPRRHELALACEDAGTLYAQRARPEEAVPLLDEAAAIYEELGAARDAARTRATLRALGVKRGPRTTRARASHGWESLTPTERKVAGLVAQRLSNPEVAERLFISRHTVESHLKHIFAKIGVSSRAQLSAEAVRHAPTM